MSVTNDRDVLRKITGFMEYLAEVTDASNRYPVRDILSGDRGGPEEIIWLEELPDGIRFASGRRDGEVLRVAPPRFPPEPRAPRGLEGWVDTVDLRGPGGPEPELVKYGPKSAEPENQYVTPHSIKRSFTSWLMAWRRWAQERAQAESRRELYERLERAAKLLEQQDDQFELVVSAGLLSWDAPNGERIYRHLIVEPASIRIDRQAAEILVTLRGGKRRFEDKEVFGDQDAYHPERARRERSEVIDSLHAFCEVGLVAGVQQWLSIGMDEPVEHHPHRWDSDGSLPQTPQLSISPALIVRPRSRALLADAYRRIAEELRKPDSQVPVALAQLVIDTERAQRDNWLRSQGVASVNVLGEDPLFPLPTNEEQQQVIELLRTETCVVVQGPPGTGKTHTIANLLSALLAGGLRVLVTSQKEQALKVLREKIPPQLRRLCVLLAGGSRDAAKELEQGLDALSDAIAAPDTRLVTGQIAALANERAAVQQRVNKLDAKILELRDSENVHHDPVVPGFSRDVYCGTLATIVREVNANSDRHDWLPPASENTADTPPLSVAEGFELLQALRTDTPERRRRRSQAIPAASQLPTSSTLSDAIKAEHSVKQVADAAATTGTHALTKLGEVRLVKLEQLGHEVVQILSKLGFGPDGHLSDDNWIHRAIDDHFASRSTGLWNGLHQLNGEASRLLRVVQQQGVSFEVELPAVEEIGVGPARGLLKAGRRLHAYLESGRKLRAVLPKSAAQREAADFLRLVTVDGHAPTEPAELEAAVNLFEAHIAVAQLIGKWADANVEVAPGPVLVALSELDAHDRALDEVVTLARLQQQVKNLLEEAHVDMSPSTTKQLLKMLRMVAPVRQQLKLKQARRRVNEMHAKVSTLAATPDACSELGPLADAIASRDIGRYRSGLEEIETAREERAAELRRGELSERLRSCRPRLLDLLQRTASQPVWETRLNELPLAWAWSKAKQFIESARSADSERQLTAERDELETRLNHLTEQLASAKAMQKRVSTMRDVHARALRSYRQHTANLGAGTGKRAHHYRRAARAEMEKAKDAVPAWVVPLSNLLENIAAERDSFDVVIIDEASQVGIEHLFLLWMAPRVIVVGDDKQCTPGEHRMGNADALFRQQSEYLSDIEHSIRMLYTAKQNLYGVLSARSGRDAVVRLREHFRCMPEIINWSSRQFYGDDDQGLIPLRERTKHDLDPLRVVQLTDAQAEGREANRRNLVEAKQIVSQLVECMTDSRYNDKTFGIIVLQGTGQIKLLEHEINAAIKPEDRVKRNLRVGTAANFQGDERDVIFLSLVDDKTGPKRIRQSFQQMYNVAASRAKDQMWLFTSIPRIDYKSDDLRASLTEYMLNPPPAYGHSPDLASVSETEHCTPFESLLEQRIFRVIKQRGYHVIPQYKVGKRALDLVIFGDGGRIAVECDGHHWHTSPQQQTSDLQRDRELRRMGWEVIRIRGSEFEYNPQHEMEPLWKRLGQRGISPFPPPSQATCDWNPIALPIDTYEEGLNQ